MISFVISVETIIVTDIIQSASGIVNREMHPANGLTIPQAQSMPPSSFVGRIEGGCIQRFGSKFYPPEIRRPFGISNVGFWAGRIGFDNCDLQRPLSAPPT